MIRKYHNHKLQINPWHQGCNDRLTSRYDTYPDTIVTIRYLSRYVFVRTNSWMKKIVGVTLTHGALTNMIIYTWHHQINAWKKDWLELPITNVGFFFCICPKNSIFSEWCDPKPVFLKDLINDQNFLIFSGLGVSGVELSIVLKCKYIGIVFPIGTSQYLLYITTYVLWTACKIVTSGTSHTAP